MAKPTIVLLVQLAGGEVVAVPFSDREKADWWEEQMPYEVVGRPQIVSARSLAIGAAIRERERRASDDS